MGEHSKDRSWFVGSRAEWFLLYSIILIFCGVLFVAAGELAWGVAGFVGALGAAVFAWRAYRRAE